MKPLLRLGYTAFAIKSINLHLLAISATAVNLNSPIGSDEQLELDTITAGILLVYAYAAPGGEDPGGAAG
jgi:hypothetical protein